MTRHGKGSTLQLLFRACDCCPRRLFPHFPDSIKASKSILSTNKQCYWSSPLRPATENSAQTERQRRDVTTQVRPPTTSSKMAVTAANNFPNRKCKTITLNVAVRVPDNHSPVDSGWLWVTVGVPGGLLQWCIRQVAIVYQNAMNWKITCYTDDRPVSPPFSRCRA